MPKVSIIVPVYNVEQYLEKCLNSIILQSLRDIEIICIDDGSTDGSAKILDSFSIKDNRVKVIHKMNAGYGDAMNVGLDMATGDYVGIVESDDYVLPGMYETLYNAAIENNLDMVKSDAYYWLEKEEFLSRIHIKWLEGFYDKVLDSLERNYFFEFYMNIWTGIYKKDFLKENNIRFHESPGASYQDNGFWMLTCIFAKRAMWLNKAFYYYRQDNPMASVRTHGKVMAMTREYEHLEDFLIFSGNKKYLPYCYLWKMIRNVGNYNRIADEEKVAFIGQMEQDYIRYSPYIQKLSYLNDYYISLIREPEDKTKEITDRKRAVLYRLQSTDSIVVYGAGKYGEMVFRIIYNEGFSKKLFCFAVTDESSKKKIGSKPVFSIGDAVQIYKNALFIVAVEGKSVAYKEMTNKLEEMQITNYISGNELIDNFYIV